MTQVTYNSEKVSKKRVYYTGSDTLGEGYCLCYDRDYGTASEADIDRAVRVEKPAAGNLRHFAGVVAAEDAGRTGPCWVTVVEPQPNPGRLVAVHTDQACVLGTTALAVTADSYAAGAPGADAPAIATAFQTVDRGGTAGVVLAQLEGVSRLGTDPAAGVSQSQAALTDSTGGTNAGTLGDVLAAQSSSGDLAAPIGATTGGTFALEDIASSGYSVGSVAQIENNFTRLVGFAQALQSDQAALAAAVNNNLHGVNDKLEQVRTDVAALLTALKNANLMAS